MNEDQSTKREEADPACYSCQGTGFIRWAGSANGKPCPCREGLGEDANV